MRCEQSCSECVVHLAVLRELLLNTIFQIPGVQRTETFLSLADAEPENFAEGLLDQMSQLSKQGQRGRSGDKTRGNQP